MDFIARHQELFSQLDQDIAHFLGAASGAQNLSQVNVQFEHLLAHAGSIEEKELVQEIESLKAEWIHFTHKPTQDKLKKIQQKALHIKQELREL
jgi:hypothetical protein